MEQLVTGDEAEKRDWTLVWIDAREALLVSWHDGQAQTRRLESEVPRQHRATGHVRHPDTGRTHAGPPRSAGETHRLEHLRRFVDEVAGRLPEADGLAVCGPGSVAVALTRRIDADDRRHKRGRQVVHRRAGRLSEAQLVAEVRQLAGDDPPRRTVGAYRWSGRQPLTSAGDAKPPRRVVRKRPQPVED